MSEATQNPSAHTPPSGGEGYEHSDTRGRAIFIGLIASILAIAVVTVFLNELFIATSEEVIAAQVSSRVDPKLAEIRARSTRNLNTYEWVDSTQGIVRIPIDRAMELMVEEAYQERMQDARRSK
ncbi:hypothetical protein KQI52_11915 [bacterium]|nr:hypothetical protein [bacterium]